MPDQPAVTVLCPNSNCQALLRACPALVGRRTVCPKCDGPIVVTTEWDDEPPTEEIELTPPPAGPQTN